MHGFIFIEYEKFALNHLSYKAWDEILAENNLQDRQYNPVTIYPDSEIRALLSSVSRRTQLPQEQLLELFGMHLVPDLMKVYRAYINPQWRTLDLLEHAENTIHVSVRKSTAGAAPPILQVFRLRHNEIEIHYVSERKMIELGVGIIKGLARFFNETDNISVELLKNEAAGSSKIMVRQLF
ncbi:heme NO-binding domain-containing protein [Adhaeribacter sp. BT258]|uniref:Heme NO-binding domain-containing protein n=1 Tax=Adhaeribacter terrigena TaxID=2793070 RepID=A0ABS1C0L0_9BACT|nr:heme NO-binding domain-containing protein [Adhaeribacter terrigena]MBK0402957.1 heme NO-binding domain-containing protein [Adhaeribacter terrigena]